MIPKIKKCAVHDIKNKPCAEHWSVPLAMVKLDRRSDFDKFAYKPCVRNNFVFRKK
jgi:hypothetical protein